MNSEYKVLSIAVVVFKVLAFAGMILGICSAVMIITGMGTSELPRWLGVVTIAGGAFYFLIFTTFSDVVKLLLEINERI